MFTKTAVVMSVLERLGEQDAFAELSRFRTAFYGCLSARAYAFFELADAIADGQGGSWILEGLAGADRALTEPLVRAAAEGRRPDAATRILEETGRENALRGVAREVGIAAPSIYLHFKDKTELAWTVLADAYRALAAEMAASGEAAAAGGADPWERMCATVDAYRRSAVDKPRKYRLMFSLEYEPEDRTGTDHPWAPWARRGPGPWRQRSRTPGSPGSRTVRSVGALAHRAASSSWTAKAVSSSAAATIYHGQPRLRRVRVIDLPHAWHYGPACRKVLRSGGLHPTGARGNVAGLRGGCW